MTTYRFHSDRHGDSVTVLVHAGTVTSDIELLVNGREVGFGQIKGGETADLDAEFPTSPPTPLHVTVRRPKHDPDPGCRLRVGGVEQVWDVSSGEL